MARWNVRKKYGDDDEAENSGAVQLDGFYPGRNRDDQCESPEWLSTDSIQDWDI